MRSCYRKRHYSPETGRFISEDPIGFMSADTNFYRYVINNPIRNIDPLGLVEYCKRQLNLTGGAMLYSIDPDFYTHAYLKFSDGSVASFTTDSWMKVAGKGKLQTEAGWGIDGYMGGSGGGPGGGSCMTIPTTKEQDKSIKDWARNNASKQYTLIGNNCADYATQAVMCGVLGCK